MSATARASSASFSSRAVAERSQAPLMQLGIISDDVTDPTPPLGTQICPSLGGFPISGLLGMISLAAEFVTNKWAVAPSGEGTLATELPSPESRSLARPAAVELKPFGCFRAIGGLPRCGLLPTGGSESCRCAEGQHVWS